MKTLGMKIAEYRKLKGMTQESLANQLNVSSQAVSKWENDLSIPDLPILIQLADLFNVSLDELIRQKENCDIARVVEAPLRKPTDQMMLKIIVNSSDGDKVRVNLPMTIVKLGMEIGMSMPEVNGQEALKGIDFDQLLSLVDNGVVGKLVEVESAEGDFVEIYVE
ncbi:MAG: helix-turn-helix domain-containing protein [Traorella sp.]